MNQQQRNSILSIVMAFLLVILLVQLWLLFGALEAFAAGRAQVGVAAALASGVCLIGAIFLFRPIR